jgi:hypothetical protein
VVCGDRASRRKFGLYWGLVGPFSGLVRLAMLQAIRRTCAGGGRRLPAGGVRDQLAGDPMKV